METAIGIIVVLLLSISIISLILGLINPRIFSKFFKNGVNRKKILLVFGLASVVCLFFVGILSNGTPSLNKIKTPTNQKTITVSGHTGYKNSTIKVYLNNELIKEMKADEKGNFSVPIELTKEGANKIMVSATNDKSKTKNSSATEVTYDTTPPELSFDQPSSPTESDRFTLKGKSEQNARIIIYSGSNEIKTTKVKKDIFEIKDIVLNEGENKFTVRAIDEADNYSLSKDITIVYQKPKPKEAAKTETEKPAETTPAPTPTSTPIQEESILEKIQSIVKNVGNYEVTIWDSNQNMASESTQPPYEIIINTGLNQISNCKGAQVALYNIMHNLYTDNQVKDKISRVKFTAGGQLKASLGSADVFYNGKEIPWSGETNFWKVLTQYKPYEDETGELNKRTWGVAIGNCN